MASISSLFFSLLQSAVKNEAPDTTSFDAEGHWEALFELAKQQTLVGVLFEAIRKLPKEKAPRRDVLLTWLAMAEQIKAANRKLNKRAADAESHFAQYGFNSCILKGQGIAKLYTSPECRMPGDIDIWVNGRRRDLVRLAKQRNPQCTIVYHHIDYALFPDAEVEVHIHPSWMYSPVKNRRLQRFFQEEACWENSTMGDVAFHVPTLRFNLVYILVHIYRHLFQEGIGLRQLMDYYYVLKACNDTSMRGFSLKTLETLGMRRFTAATMWVMQNVFGLEDEYLLCRPNEEEGRFLLSEIMQAGNFGFYDARINRTANESAFHVFVRKTRRNMHFLTRYPSEVLWSPLWKIGHFVWRKTYILIHK